MASTQKWSNTPNTEHTVKLFCINYFFLFVGAAAAAAALPAEALLLRIIYGCCLSFCRFFSLSQTLCSTPLCHDAM